MLTALPEASLSLLENSSVNLSAEQNVLNALNVCKNLDILSSPAKDGPENFTSTNSTLEFYNFSRKNSWVNF